jgi:hypothetical protein
MEYSAMAVGSLERLWSEDHPWSPWSPSHPAADEGAEDRPTVAPWMQNLEDGLDEDDLFDDGEEDEDDGGGGLDDEFDEEFGDGPEVDLDDEDEL